MSAIGSVICRHSILHPPGTDSHLKADIEGGSTRVSYVLPNGSMLEFPPRNA
jgi:hypothetical protein